MHPEIEKLIDLALADGQITDKERAIILRKAEKLGEDIDEVEMILEGKLSKLAHRHYQPITTNKRKQEFRASNDRTMVYWKFGSLWQVQC